MTLNNKNKKFSRDKEGKIKKIIETTLDLIAKKGYDKISTNHIATASNISIGTIYRYFPEGKSAIVISAAEIMLSKLPLKDLAISIDAEDFKDFINKLIRFYITYHRENIMLMKATDKATLSSRIVRDEINIFIEKILHHTLNLLHRFPALRDYSDQVLEQKFILILKTIDGVIHSHLFHSPFFDDDDELLTYLTNLSLKIIEME